ncbi:hypothetical protein R1sor_025958 [Riccia sorocarpa]|uniref:Sugar phosphate transporter domain-containing protein n=1 Tax=Riccia sorocarpa TaxID=122646 RepID=A0ABD3GD39_9MARC
MAMAPRSVSWTGIGGTETQDAAVDEALKVPNGSILTMNGSTGTKVSPVGNGIRRAHSHSRVVAGHEEDLELGDPEDTLLPHDRPLQKSRNQSLVSGVCYCLSSCSMILLNKVVLSGYNLHAGISLMFYQNLISVGVVLLLNAMGLIVTERITWKLVKVWIPVNILFVCMLVSSIFSLRFLNVAMVTILKNVTNLITALGEIYFFNKHHSTKVWLSLCVMVLSAVSGGVTDLSFHGNGYLYQLINCFCTSAYSLRLRKVMDLAKEKTKTKTLNEFTMVLLNNLLSLPLGLALILIFETQTLQDSPALKIPMFWVVATLSGLLGLAISFTSMWFMHQTSPTTHSLVGSLNKIPLSLAGILLFRVPTSFPNLVSIFFGLLAGVLFAVAKMS